MLSLEQQKNIEDSLWVVNTALKRQGLQADEDLRQSAILYMCKCLERFDPTKKIKWTTYAYKNIFLYIKRMHVRESKKSSIIVDDDLYNLERVIQPIEDQNDIVESSYRLDRVRGVCSAEERRVIDLKLQGYKAVEISALMKCSASKINACMQSIKDKARGMEF